MHFDIDPNEFLRILAAVDNGGDVTVAATDRLVLVDHQTSRADTLDVELLGDRVSTIARIHGPGPFDNGKDVTLAATDHLFVTENKHAQAGTRAVKVYERGRRVIAYKGFSQVLEALSKHVHEQERAERLLVEIADGYVTFGKHRVPIKYGRVVPFGGSTAKKEPSPVSPTFQLPLHLPYTTKKQPPVVWAAEQLLLPLPPKEKNDDQLPTGLDHPPTVEEHSKRQQQTLTDSMVPIVLSLAAIGFIVAVAWLAPIKSALRPWAALAIVALAMGNLLYYSTRGKK
jgi:hypothetical protein